MNSTPEHLRDHVRSTIDELRALRSEIRVRVHLATMDARDAWARLEPEYDEAERLARQATRVTSQAIEQLVDKFRRFRDTLPRA